ncbi:MAG: biotin/lipoyl-containing protein [Candidatus Neomarinimicrobiota bacterium]
MKFKALIDDLTLEFAVERQAAGFLVRMTDRVQNIDCIRLSPYSYSLIINGASHYLSLTVKNGGYRVTIDQQSFCVRLKDETQILLEKFGLNPTAAGTAQNILAPIPGLVKQILVKPGDRVNLKDKLLILEAMKMENEILSTASGTVGEIFVKQGITKNKGDLLLRIDGD